MFFWNSLTVADELRIVIIYSVTVIQDQTVKEFRSEQLQCSVNKRLAAQYTSMFSLNSQSA